MSANAVGIVSTVSSILGIGSTIMGDRRAFFLQTTICVKIPHLAMEPLGHRLTGLHPGSRVPQWRTQRGQGPQTRPSRSQQGVRCRTSSFRTQRRSHFPHTTHENSAVEDSTPGLPFRVAGSKGERLPTLYPEHLARRRRRVPGAALGTVSPTALFSLTHSTVRPRCRQPFRTEQRCFPQQRG